MILSLAVLWSLAAASSAFAQMEHFTGTERTSQFVQFWGEFTINSSDADIGDEVGVYDPDGILCGAYKVETEGYYGFLPVYRDDSATTDIDEGASPGDVLTFKIWDQSADKETAPAITVVSGQGPPQWTANLDIWQVNLTASQPAGLSQINLGSPVAGSLLASPPTFTWTSTGGTNNVFAVDLSLSYPITAYWSTYESAREIIREDSWTPSAALWSRISSGSYIYWRTRGADLAAVAAGVVYSDEVFWLYKQ